MCRNWSGKNLRKVMMWIIQDESKISKQSRYSTNSKLWDAKDLYLVHIHFHLFCKLLGIHLAMSTFSPIGSLSTSCMSVCVCVWMEWTWSMHYIGISTYQFLPYYASAIHKHTRTCIFKLFEDSEPTGAKSGYCHAFECDENGQIEGSIIQSLWIRRKRKKERKKHW